METLKKIFQTIKKVIIIGSILFTLIFILLIVLDDEEYSYDEEYSNEEVYTYEERPSYSEEKSKVNKWRNLERGMTKGQVRRILGEPLKVEVFSFGERWEYGPYSFEKKVDFDTSGLVKGWSE